MSKLFLLFFLGLSVFSGCKKDESDHPCYDSSIVHNGPCTTDCPGIEGCDGKKYCNECEAARHGIRKK